MSERDFARKFRQETGQTPAGLRDHGAFWRRRVQSLSENQGCHWKAVAAALQI